MSALDLASVAQPSRVDPPHPGQPICQRLHGVGRPSVVADDHPHVTRRGPGRGPRARQPLRSVERPPPRRSRGSSAAACWVGPIPSGDVDGHRPAELVEGHRDDAVDDHLAGEPRGEIRQRGGVPRRTARRRSPGLAAPATSTLEPPVTDTSLRRECAVAALATSAAIDAHLSASRDPSRIALPSRRRAAPRDRVPAGRCPRAPPRRVGRRPRPRAPEGVRWRTLRRTSLSPSITRADSGRAAFLGIV